MTSCLGTVKACWDADLRQFQEARLCAAPGRSQRRAGLQQGIDAGKSLGHASGMTAAIAVSRCCGLLKILHQELAQRTRLTQKYSLLGQRSDRSNDNRVALSEGGIDGYRRGAGTTILSSAWVLQLNIGAGVVGIPQRRRWSCEDCTASP